MDLADLFADGRIIDAAATDILSRADIDKRIKFDKILSVFIRVKVDALKRLLPAAIFPNKCF